MKRQAANPNRFCFAEHAIISRSEGGWNAAGTDGSTAFLNEAEFSRRAFAIDCKFGENGFYAILDGFRQHASYAYRIDGDDGLVWLENGSVPLPVHDFLMTAVRADAEGRPVCSFLSSADDQLLACTEAGAEGHVAEIMDGTTAYGNSLVRDWLDAAAAGNSPLDNGEFLSMVA